MKKFESFSLSLDAILQSVILDDYPLPEDDLSFDFYQRSFGTQYSTPRMVRRFYFYLNQIENMYEEFWSLFCDQEDNLSIETQDKFETKRREFYKVYEAVVEIVSVLLDQNCEQNGIVQPEDYIYLLHEGGTYTIVSSSLDANLRTPLIRNHIRYFKSGLVSESIQGLDEEADTSATESRVLH